MITAKFGDRYRARDNEPSPYAAGYVLLTVFTVRLDSYHRPAVAIFAHEYQQTYIWRRRVLNGKLHGKYAWVDCMTTYTDIGDAIADVVKYCVDAYGQYVTHTQRS